MAKCLIKNRDNFNFYHFKETGCEGMEWIQLAQ
jgi:hypothetical protein